MLVICRSYFTSDSESALPEEETVLQEELLPELQAASVQSQITMGERRDQRVRRMVTAEQAEARVEACVYTVCSRLQDGGEGISLRSDAATYVLRQGGCLISLYRDPLLVA